MLTTTTRTLTHLLRPLSRTHAHAPSCPLHTLCTTPLLSNIVTHSTPLTQPPHAAHTFPRRFGSSQRAVERRSAHKANRQAERAAKRDAAEQSKAAALAALAAQNATAEITLPSVCCGCGATFQTVNSDFPGFISEATWHNYVAQRRQYEREFLAQHATEHLQAQHELYQQQSGENAAEQTEEQQEEAEEERTASSDVTEEINADEMEGSAEQTAEHDTTRTEEKADDSETVDADTVNAHDEQHTQESHTDADHHDDMPITRLQRLEEKLGTRLTDTQIADALMRGLIDESDVEPSGIMPKNEVLSLLKKDKDRFKPLRCQRCYQLTHYGHAKGNLNAVRAQDFRLLLRSRFVERGGKSSVILKVIDMFDIHGSFIQDFTKIVGGRNPVILVGNKSDLLPRGWGPTRIKAWLKHEADLYGLQYHSVQLVSAKTGDGIPGLMRKAAELASSNSSIGQRDIYIVGTTNVGKSTLVNKMMAMKYISSKAQFEATKINVDELYKHDTLKGETQKWEQKQQAGTAVYLNQVTAPAAAPATPSTSAEHNNSTDDHNTSNPPSSLPMPVAPYLNIQGGKMTESVMPGTTLGMVAFPLIPAREGTLYDTPGVINTDSLLSHMSYDELVAVMPKSQIRPQAYRMKEGLSLLLGGLARLDFVSGRPFFFTVFASPRVSVHITSTSRLDAEQGVGQLEFVKKHVGDKDSSLIYPPYTLERYEQLNLQKGSRVLFDLAGRGWLESSDDIVFPGLGWISLTGCGPIQVRAIAAAGTKPYCREPVMPFEAQRTMKKWTGVGNRYA